MGEGEREGSWGRIMGEGSFDDEPFDEPFDAPRGGAAPQSERAY